MENLIKKLSEEYYELDSKYQKLSDVVKNFEYFPEISDYQKQLLSLQYTSMATCLQALSLRIQDLQNNNKTV